MKQKLTIITLCLLLWGLPSAAQAALWAGTDSTVLRSTELSNVRRAAQSGIEFKVAREGDGWTVLMRPNATPAGAGRTLTAQVTVRVPHGEGVDRFAVSNLQSLVAGVFWTQPSRADAPSETPDSDYISFEFDYFLSDFDAIDWQAGQAVKLFTFQNSGSYQGELGLMENCDAFSYPNSLNTNPGNQIAVQGLDINNAYIGNYDVAVGSACAADVYLPLINR